jgi:hypothetical protein
VLHLGGNGFSGSIPNVLITTAMTELVLSSNQLTGSIPDSIWQSNITRLDLSLNRLQGTLPSDMLPAAQLQLQALHNNDNSSSTVSVKLQVNQLAGTIPDWLHSLSPNEIHMLEGNLFSCNADRSDLPANDPKSATYECGSDNTNYGLIAFGTALLCASIVASVYRYYVRAGSQSGYVEMTASFNKHYGESEVGKLWEHIERAVYVIVGMWIVGMIVYGSLSLQFSSYAEVYVWAVSAVYKMGTLPALTLLFFLTCFLLFAMIFKQWLSQRQCVENRVFRPVRTKHVSCLTVSVFVLLFVINAIIVTSINGLYVYFVVSEDYAFSLLLMVAFFLSIFKIIWNYVLLRGSQSVEAISDHMIVWLCLFNNLLAPLLAEMFVSSDCFLYIVTQSPALQFHYDVYSCQMENLTEGNAIVCRLPTLFKQGYGTPEEVSIIPPFHYSYQCSFSLIASYTYVFIFRYVITWVIEPLVQILIYHVIQRYSCGRDLRRLLPPQWQAVSKLSCLSSTDWWKYQVEHGTFRRRLVVIFATDISMLICFGALFPPLAVIIALSVLKDVMSIRLALGRYCEIIEAVQDESLKEQMVKVRETMDKEMLKAGAGIWNGVWHGMVMGTWIWGFVLFDTMASVEGVGKGMCMLIGMVASPFILYWIFYFSVVGRETVVPKVEDDVNSSCDGYRFSVVQVKHTSTKGLTLNPIAENNIEMLATTEKE